MRRTNAVSEKESWLRVENINGIIEKSRSLERAKILSMIETERDAGNMVGGGFSAALCLSKIIKYLRGEG